MAISRHRALNVPDSPCRKMSDGMFLSACRAVAKDYPNIAYDEDLLDRACLRVSVPSLTVLLLHMLKVDAAISLDVMMLSHRLCKTPSRMLTGSWSCPTCMVTSCPTCAPVLSAASA
jgi:hypothetical protein